MKTEKINIAGAEINFILIDDMDDNVIYSLNVNHPLPPSLIKEGEAVPNEDVLHELIKSQKIIVQKFTF